MQNRIVKCLSPIWSNSNKYQNFSDWLEVPAGVPQGTRLGLWLFLVMINDLKVDKKNSFLWKFADDSTLSERFQGIVQAYYKMILIIFHNDSGKSSRKSGQM
jgi:hypothetical protein